MREFISSIDLERVVSLVQERESHLEDVPCGHFTSLKEMSD